jgi:hypothetical protein
MTILLGYDTDMKEKNVRWEDEDWERIEKAAKLEDLIPPITSVVV